MKEINLNPKVEQRHRDMARYILVLLQGEKPSIFEMTERFRQYCTWDVKRVYIIISKCGCYGIQFNVSGLKFKGRVRVWYNPGSDYFDVEFLRLVRNEVVKDFDDLDFIQLHNVLHKHIEREDDPEVF